MSDARMVYIKRIKTMSEEARIGRMFSEPGLRDKPSNHCVPILDFFPDEEDQSMSYMVMPFLRNTNDPPFEMVYDVIDLVDQLLEVCQFYLTV